MKKAGNENINFHFLLFNCVNLMLCDDRVNSIKNTDYSMCETHIEPVHSLANHRIYLYFGGLLPDF